MYSYQPECSPTKSVCRGLPSTYGVSNQKRDPEILENMKTTMHLKHYNIGGTVTFYDIIIADKLSSAQLSYGHNSSLEFFFFNQETEFMAKGA